MAVEFLTDVSFAFVFFPIIKIKSLQDPMRKLVEKEGKRRIAQQEIAEAVAEEPSQ